MRRSAKYLSTTFLVILSAALPSAAFAQTHVDNPFVGATVYASPAYAAKVQTSIAQVTDTALKAKMQIVAQTPTFTWLDTMSAIAGSATAMGLQEHLDNALAQKQGSTPIVAEFVIYDLPGRDCHALASNGELPLTAAGLATYKASYIDPIVAIMSQPQYAGIRIVNVIEPDSLPNLVTNLSTPACGAASSTGIYVTAIQYALNKLHLPNIYNYVDIGHSGWLGWTSNSGPAVSLFTQVANGTTAGLASIDGFVSNTANDTALHEPFLTGSQTVGGQTVSSSTFYQFNPDIDEVSYMTDMYQRFIAAGWPASLGFLTDTSRNGWGGPGRPTAASTSTDLNTFVNASRTDPRPHRGLWCNQSGAGLGQPPQATPPGFASAHIDAFVWVKPPGDSDGSSTLIPNNEGKGFDRFCDPTFTTPDGVLTNALPNAPLSGHWFHDQFVQLVTNALPVVGGAPACGTTPGAVTTFTATPISASQINLSWSPVSPAANCSITYNVFRSTVVGFTPTAANQIASGLTATAFSDMGLTAVTTFQYVIQAVDTAGVSAVTRASATTLGAGNCTAVPPAVTNLTATPISASQINLTWSSVLAPPNCSVTYTVFRSTTVGFTPSATNQVASGLTTTASSSTGLAIATTYQFVVVAVDAAGTSAVTRVAATTTGAGNAACHVGYTVVNSWSTGFQVALSLQNTGALPINGWTLSWTFPGTQQISSLWNGVSTQTGATVSVTSMPYNGTIAPGASYNDMGFTGSLTGTNPAPIAFAINGTPCN